MPLGVLKASSMETSGNWNAPSSAASLSNGLEKVPAVGDSRALEWSYDMAMEDWIDR